MYIVCSDMEGVFTPEVWINVAKKTGIEELKLTTRDISDYDVLMKKRISILKEHGVRLGDIRKVIAVMEPLDGALEFLNWLRKNTQVIVVSDTFIQFSESMMQKLHFPTLFCNSLIVDNSGNITGYNMRQKDGKSKTVDALRSLNYRIIGIGDSYNDIAMLQNADSGFLFNPPDNVKQEFNELPAAYNYDDLKNFVGALI